MNINYANWPKDRLDREALARQNPDHVGGVEFEPRRYPPEPARDVPRFRYNDSVDEYQKSIALENWLSRELDKVKSAALARRKRRWLRVGDCAATILLGLLMLTAALGLLGINILDLL